MEISLLRGEWGCEILVANFRSEFWKFLASPSLCSNCISLTTLLTYYIHLYFVFFCFCQKHIFTYILNSPTFCFFFFQNNCIFYKTQIFFEILNCKGGHMLIFVLKLKKKVLEKVEFFKFKFQIYSSRKKVKTEEIPKMHIFNHYEKFRCIKVFLRYIL